MQDRQPKNPGRIKLTLDDGTVLHGVMERDDSPTAEGTPLNKDTLFNDNNSTRYAVDIPSRAFELLGKVWGPFTASKTGWSASADANGYYTQQITASGMSAEYYPAVLPVYETPATRDLEKMMFGEIDKIETLSGAIKLYITDVPDVNLKFILVGV